MMAGLATSGLLLFGLLTGVINGYPAKKALEPLGASSTNPFGSSRKKPGPGYSYAESAFPTAPKQAVLFHTDEQPRNTHPRAQMRPVPALYDSNAYSPSVNRGFDGGFPVGSTQPRFQLPPNQGQWAVDPPTFSSRTSPAGEPRFVSESSSYQSAPGPFPQFQPGDASYEEKIYEQGDYDSESEDKGPPAHYLPVLPLNELNVGSPLALGTLVDRFRNGYPLMEYLLLRRRYPPGTYTLSANQLDHRKNQWHDSRQFDPYRSSHKQLETFPYLYGKRHPIGPMKTSIGHGGYGISDHFG